MKNSSQEQITLDMPTIFNPVTLYAIGLVFIAFTFFPPTGIAAESEKLKNVKIMGIDPYQADFKKVRKHFLELGGFWLSRDAFDHQHINLDKFYPWSNMRDSYYIAFNYNPAGKITSVKRVYRPYSKHFNKRTALETRDIARHLIEELGQPTQIVRKGWGGMPTYPSYIWQNEQYEIRIDREGSEILGNVFVEYTLKSHDRYETKTAKRLAKQQG